MHHTPLPCIGAVRGIALAVLVLLAASAVHAAPSRVALLPIVIHSVDPETAYLSLGLADMLSARLERSGKIEVVVATNATPVSADWATAAAAASAAGAEYVLFGSFTQFGAGASLDVRCGPVAPDSDPGERRRIFIQSGSIGEIIPKLDTLAEKITRYIAGGPSAGAASNLAGAPSAAARNDELTRRLEALERAVFENAGRAGASADVESAVTGPVAPPPSP